MLKKKSYSVLSNKTCTVCGKYLKQNLVDKNPDAEYCFKHYQNFKKNKPLSGDIKMTKNEISFIEESKAVFPNAVNDVEAMDLFAQKLYSELREMENLGQDSGKEFNAKKRKYKKVRDEYLELRENFIEQESSMEVVK